MISKTFSANQFYYNFLKMPRGLAFQCSSGHVVKVKEAMCWRHIEGRSCFPSAKRFSSAAAGGAHEDGESRARIIINQNPDCVVVPIAPSVAQLRERRAGRFSTDTGLGQYCKEHVYIVCTCANVLCVCAHVRVCVCERERFKRREEMMRREEKRE